MDPTLFKTSIKLDTAYISRQANRSAQYCCSKFVGKRIENREYVQYGIHTLRSLTPFSELCILFPGVAKNDIVVYKPSTWSVSEAQFDDITSPWRAVKEGRKIIRVVQGEMKEKSIYKIVTRFWDKAHEVRL